VWLLIPGITSEKTGAGGKIVLKPSPSHEHAQRSMWPRERNINREAMAFCAQQGARKPSGLCPRAEKLLRHGTLKWQRVQFMVSNVIEKPVRGMHIADPFEYKFLPNKE
jgi:hypothetical protein